MYLTTHAPEIQKHPEVANKEQDEVGTPLVYERCAPAAAISDENNSVRIQLNFNWIPWMKEKYL